MQTHLQVVHEIGHGLVRGVKLVDVMVVDLGPLELSLLLGDLVGAFGQDTPLLHNLSLVKAQVPLQGLDFEKALFGFVKVDVLVDVRGQTDLALTAGHLAAEFVAAADGQRPTAVEHTTVLLMHALPSGQVLVPFSGNSGAVALADRRERIAILLGERVGLVEGRAHHAACLGEEADGGLEGDDFFCVSGKLDGRLIGQTKQILPELLHLLLLDHEVFPVEHLHLRLILALLEKREEIADFFVDDVF